MWCFVSEPNGTIHELILPKESRGFDCLDMISSRIHLIEKDYFGLRYTNSSGVDVWLNLRNKISNQLTGKAPHRIQLMVKFFVKVQELQQPVTRDLYYDTLLYNIRSGKLNIEKLDNDTLAKLVALVAQVEYGDFNAESLPDYLSLLSIPIEWTTDLQKSVETQHLNLDMVSASESKIGFITMASEFDNYGVEHFYVTSVCEKPEELILGVRHDGLRIYQPNAKNKLTKEDKLIQFILYDEISTVSYKGKRFTIVHGDNKAEHTHSSFQLKKNQGAITLFRAFTECHSFFQCNLVKQSVIEKSTKTSLGRMFSIFKTNTNRGKIFLFDVVRTRRQAYNHAWSILNAPNKNRQSAFYHSDRNFNRKSVYSLSKVDDGSEYKTTHTKRNTLSIDFEIFHSLKDMQCKSKTTLSESSDINELSVETLRETVCNLIEYQTCQVCMDNAVSTAFCPCGHVVCCEDCATMCRECPLCRTQITYAQKVFFSGR